MSATTYGGLPAIPTYDVADTSWDTYNRVSWTVDRRRSALLVHDMQGFYVNSLPPGTIDPLVRKIEQLRQACYLLGIPVYYSVAKPCVTAEERGLLLDFHGWGMKDVPEHHRIDARLEPGPDDVIVTKKIYSAFFDTPLAGSLEAKGKSQLIIAGVYASIGCQITAFDAMMRGVQAFYVADAMIAYSEEEHRQSADYVSRLCASVRSTDTVLAQLDSNAQ